jgi:pre-mRNA cleavage complex 2 protein Pcf11
VISTNSLAARLRSEIASRSRSGTPELFSSHGTPPKTSSLLKNELKKKSPSPSSEPNVTGMKRKVEEGTSINTEADGSPPVKKLAVST